MFDGIWNFIVRRRPSKLAMLRQLKRALSNEYGAIGIDAASSCMKYRRLFKTKQYLAIDINEAALRRGIQRYPKDTAILAHLARPFLRDNSIDVCVSTNTLEHLSAVDQEKALKNFIAYLKPEGRLFLTKKRDAVSPKLLQIVYSSFERVQICYYRNRLSRWYESWFVEKNGKLTHSQIARWLPLKWATMLLSGLEHLTARYPNINSAMYIWCTDKKI